MIAKGDATPVQPAKQTRYFRPRSTVAPLSREQAAREGAIIRLAFETLGGSKAQAFLNTVDPALDGRPLTIATATPEGAARVSAMIRSLA